MKYQMEEPWALYFLRAVRTIAARTKHSKQAEPSVIPRMTWSRDSRTSRPRSWRNWAVLLPRMG